MPHEPEIRRSTNEVGVLIELVMSGQTLLSAEVDWRDLELLESLMGWGAEDVQGMVEASLRLHRSGEAPDVHLSSPRPLGPDHSRFVSFYVEGVTGRLRAGVVWYDTTTTQTGPTEVATPVRREMRLSVNRCLAGSRANEALVDKLLQWDSFRASDSNRKGTASSEPDSTQRDGDSDCEP